MINEKLIHFIWRFQVFDSVSLFTTNNQKLEIRHPGIYNQNAGPDFFQSSILLDGMEWQGSIEIHVDASDWTKHGHGRDPGYNNVVLHVVWEGQADAMCNDGYSIPTVCIKDRVPRALLDKHVAMSSDFEIIPCATQIKQVDPSAFRQALEEQFDRRQEQKVRDIFTQWHRNRFDWEQTSFSWLCRHMGFKVNNDCFEVLGQSVPYKLLLRHRDQPLQVEALLFGMAGMLGSGHVRDVYWQRLRKEFLFLKHKYRLKVRIKPHEWKFLRLRPANFPSLRIAQLAGIVISSDSILNWLLFEFSMDAGQAYHVSDYWKNHYYFGKSAASFSGQMGRMSRQQLWMNVVPPLRISLNVQRGNVEIKDEVYSSYFALPPENNRITRKWKDLGVKMESAMDSQSYYALFHQACKLRKCLDCAVGINLLQTS